MSFRTCLAALAALLMQHVAAQTYPSKPIRLVSQYPAGALVDVVTRQMGQELAKNWNQPLVVENRPGANNILAMSACAKAPADGYTICHLGRSTTMLPFLGAKLPFDLEKDFDPVTNMMYTVLALVSHPSANARNLNELVQSAKAQPGKLNYASLGQASVPHLLMEWINNKYSISITHIPYKGPPAVLNALLSGEAHFTYVGVANFATYHHSGKLRILAVSGDKRSPLVPEVPTLAEQGLTGLDIGTWFGLVAPAGTPREPKERIYREVARVFAIPAFLEKNLIPQAFDPINSSPEEFAKSLRAERESNAELVRISGAKLEQ